MQKTNNLSNKSLLITGILTIVLGLILGIITIILNLNKYISNIKSFCNRISYNQILQTEHFCIMSKRKEAKYIFFLPI